MLLRATTTSLALLLALPTASAQIAGAGIRFTPGNILVTQDKTLREYTRTGTLVQTISVPNPATTRYDVVDVVMDRFGRAHVGNWAPFANSYLSTYDPATDTWRHTLDAEGFLGNVSDGDLTRMGDTIWTKTRRFDVRTFDNTRVNPGGFCGASELTMGKDGLLYEIFGCFPRHEVRVYEPFTLRKLRTISLRDSFGTRLSARGIAITKSGDIYAADWNGKIYHLDDTGAHKAEIDSGTRNLVDINLHPDGTLVCGAWFGDIVFTDTDFSFTRKFNSGGRTSYTCFVSCNPTGKLELSASPAEPKAGDTLRLTTCENLPDNDAYVFAVAVNGMPLVDLCFVQKFDINGLAIVSRQVPLGLQGTLTMQSFACTGPQQTCGTILESNRFTITFR